MVLSLLALPDVDIAYETLLIIYKIVIYHPSTHQPFPKPLAYAG
jgi:hypothetical protein